MLSIFSLAGGWWFGCSGETSNEFLRMNDLRLPEGFVAEPATLSGLVTYPTFATFDPEGRLFVIESSGQTTSTEDVLENPTFKIVLLQDEDEDGVFDKRSVFADRLPYPMGGTFYRGSFYATVPPDVIRFTDTDGDNVADQRDVILTGWTLNHNAATLSGPFFGPDGWMYMCDARRGFNINTREGTVLRGEGARIWRCRPDGTGLEWVSGGGFDNTIELVFMPSGETIGTMTYFTDPQDGLRDALMHWVEGGVYPKPNPVIAADELKLTGELMPVMTKLARVSPAGLMRYRNSTFGEEYTGNLFSAQFNTGRIMRHIIQADGATYRTKDEPFLTMNAALHPTDVLEDADGSLLVVNTGGWFIAGCPLSVTAKAGVHGGIIRIRKAGAPKVSDARGNEINFEQLPAERLSVFLDDPRPVVRERAMEQMIKLGDASTAYLIDMIRSSKTEEERAAAVFALYRQGTDEALRAALLALDDTSSMVRTASARVLGLAKFKPAVEVLCETLSDPDLNVRRQAATALGQIGDPSAAIPLLKAAEFYGDRFTDHAIIHSLIQLGQTGPLLVALNHPDEGVRSAALIALDQIDESPIAKKHVIPFLESNDSLIQRTGIWVVSHHSEWSDLVLQLIARYFRKGMTDSEEKVAKELLTTFPGNRDVNAFLLKQLSNGETPVARKLLLLEVMMERRVHLDQKDVPILENLLHESNRELQSGVLKLIQFRGIPGIDATLNRLIWDEDALPVLRMQALRARVMTRPELSDEEFHLLLDLSSPATDAHVRRIAVALLAQAELNDKQLLLLAKDHLPDADVFLLPGLLDAFEDANDKQVGITLVQALRGAPERLEHVSIEQLNRILAAFPRIVRESAEIEILKRTLEQRHTSRLARLQNIETKLEKGDVGEGRRLFFGKALCATCHSVAGNGAVFGPDLTNIGEIRSQHDILEAIVYPAASLAREFESSLVKTRTTSYTGIIREQSSEVIVVETGPGAIVRIPSNDVVAIAPQDLSMMPPGLDKQLSVKELSDLMAYLTTLPDGMGHLRRSED